MSRLPPVWEAAIKAWTTTLHKHHTPSTVDLRRRHIRSVAKLSHTAHPTHLTPETLTNIYRRQQWAFDYGRDIKTSVDCFYVWAIETGLAEANPVTELPLSIS